MRLSHLLCLFSVLAMMIVSLFFMHRDNKEILSYNFNARVDSVWYDNNSSTLDNVTKPFVSIKGKTYYLYYHTWDFGYKIHKGDSLIKRANTFIITLVKKNGKVVVYGKN